MLINGNFVINTLVEYLNISSKNEDFIQERLKKRSISFGKSIVLILTFFYLVIENENDKNEIINILIDLFVNIENGSTCLNIKKEDYELLEKYENIFVKDSEIEKYLEECSIENEGVNENCNNIFADKLKKRNYNGGNAFFVLVKTDQNYYLYTEKSYIEERKLSKILIERLKDNEKKVIDLQFTDDIDSNLKESIEKILSYNTFFITGGPGTGKTYLSAQVYKVFKNYFFSKEKRYPVIKFCAPTGKAAKVLKDKIKEKFNEDVDVSTIHRLLSYNPSINGFDYNYKNKLECDLLLVDESSMIDISLFRKLIEAVKDQTKLIFVGDKDQLPSVEYGNVFADILDSNIDCVIKLEKTYRSNDKILQLVNFIKEIDDRTDEKTINENILKYLHKFEFDSEIFLDGRYDYGVYFFEISESENFPVNKLKNFFVKNLFSNKEQTEHKKVVILTPHNEVNFLGSDFINRIIKKEFEKSKHLNNIQIPIIITENDYENNIFNGEIGFLKDNYVYFYDGERNENNVKKIHLLNIKSYKYAFCITIHKSQGSEYDDVFIFIPDKESQILTKKLIYTAITRAKNRVFIVGNFNLFCKSLKRDIERVSGLPEKLKSCLHYRL